MRYAISNFISFGLIVCVALVCAAVTTVHAQAPSGIDKVSLKLDPSVPGPLEEVEVEVVSYAMDVDRATVVWLINGEEYTRGVGLDSIEFVTGAVGSATTIEVRLQGHDGGRGDTYRVVRPAFVSVLWEGNSYTPPLYRGLGLHGPETTVRIVAEPLLVNAEGVRLDPSQIKYEWHVNRDFLAEESGTGRRVIDVRNPKFVRDLEVRVVATSPDGSIGAQRTLFIPVAQPELHFYEVHPLQGILYERALGDAYTMVQSEGELVVEPFHLTADSREDTHLEYEWKLDGLPVPDARGRITIRPEGSGEGSARLALLIRNTNVLLQVARGELDIRFTTEAREQGFFTREQ